MPFECQPSSCHETQVPKVSVGMPVYNGENFIREALDSLLAQTFTDFELIISDNASTDRTEAICREYAAKDVRIRYERQGENRGAIANFKFVLDEAQGEYFMWAAADDKWDKEWIEKLLKNIRGNTAISFGHVVSISENDEIIKTYKYRPYSRIRIIRLIQFFIRESSIYGKPNLIYSIFKTNFLKRYKMRIYNNATFAPDVHFIFDLIQSSIVVTDISTKLYKRTVIDSYKVIQSRTPFKARLVLLHDILIHQITFLIIVHGFFTKVLLSIILPINFFKSLVIRIIQSLCFKRTKLVEFLLK